MIKKVPVSALKPGMYIHDLAVDWMNHPFARNHFLLRQEADIEKMIAAGIHEVYIDTAQGLDVADAPTRAEVQAALHEEMLAAVQSAAPPIRLSVAEELSRARSVATQAQRAVRAVMRDVRLGQAIQVDALSPLVEDITQSIARSAGALTALLRLKTADEYTFQHSVAVCALMVTFCRSAGFDADLVQRAGMGGLLHDTGKMKVPDSVLNKPGRLTEAEFEIMKRHPSDGWDILKATPGVDDIALDITLHHHERRDGSGYPHKLGGEQISTLARMAAIVDVYDAITSNRCYHVGMPPTEALRSMWEWTKHHLDPALMQSFIRIVGIYPVGALVKLESGRIGVVAEHNENDMLRPKIKVFFSSKANARIVPEMVDLSRNLGAGGGDRIVGHEDPAAWKIDPMRLLEA